MADFDASFWDRRYEGDGYVFGTEPNAWLVDHAAALPASGRACASPMGRAAIACGSPHAA